MIPLARALWAVVGLAGVVRADLLSSIELHDLGVGTGDPVVFPAPAPVLQVWEPLIGTWSNAVAPLASALVPMASSSSIVRDSDALARRFSGRGMRFLYIVFRAKWKPDDPISERLLQRIGRDDQRRELFKKIRGEKRRGVR